MTKKTKEIATSELMRKYLFHKIFLKKSETTESIDKEIKLLNRLSKQDEIELKMKNIDYMIKELFNNLK